MLIRPQIVKFLDVKRSVIRADRIDIICVNSYKSFDNVAFFQPVATDINPIKEATSFM